MTANPGFVAAELSPFAGSGDSIRRWWVASVKTPWSGYLQHGPCVLRYARPIRISDGPSLPAFAAPCQSDVGPIENEKAQKTLHISWAFIGL